MAGYMRKLNGHVYDGSHIAEEPLTNGIFAELTKTGVKAITADNDMVLRVAEKTTLWGMEALVLDVVSEGAKEVFFVENEWDVHDVDYDTANYTCKKGDFVKMHRCIVGEQLIMTVDNSLYTTLEIGDEVTPTAKGTVKKQASEAA